jgi:hypothetical protein
VFDSASRFGACVSAAGLVVFTPAPTSSLELKFERDDDRVTARPDVLLLEAPCDGDQENSVYILDRFAPSLVGSGSEARFRVSLLGLAVYEGVGVANAAFATADPAALSALVFTFPWCHTIVRSLYVRLLLSFTLDGSFGLRPSRLCGPCFSSDNVENGQHDRLGVFSAEFACDGVLDQPLEVSVSYVCE